MPKFGTHILIAELAAEKRLDLFDGEAPTNPFRLGAVGPDLTLFLFDPVTSPIVRSGFDVAINVLSEIRRIKKELDAIAEKFKGPIEDLTDWVTGGLSTDMTAILEAGLEAMMLAAKLGVARGTGSLKIQNPLFRLIALHQFDPRLLSNPRHAVPEFVIDSADNYGFPFRYFGHPLTDDGDWKQPELAGDYSKWWWMDMLHYRKTGSFATALLQHANDPVTKAYARGYMSHVAGDICGHPFINAIVQGPFRNHAYRHMVLEGLADTWLWNQQGRGDIIDSQLHAAIELGRPDLDKVSKLIVDTMRATYSDPVLPNLLPDRYPRWEEIRGAYQRMYLYLDLSTSGGVTRPVPPPENPGDVLDEIQKLLSRNAPGPLPAFDRHNPINYVIAILGWLLRGIVFLAMLATLPIAALLRFVNLAPRWLLYVIHLAIYIVISGLRSLLALVGWGYAGKDDFATFSFFKQLITVDVEQLIHYPYQSTLRPKPPYYWLVTPSTIASPEIAHTIVGPIPDRATPNWIVDSTNTMSQTPGFLEALITAPTPVNTKQLMEMEREGFGNAVDFLIALMDQKLPIPDLDLDGDRGYGYRPWEELPPNERYI